MERITTTIEQKTLIEIRRIAGERGVSKFIQQAAEERLARLRTLALLDELDARYGKPSQRLLAEVDADMRKFFKSQRRGQSKGNTAYKRSLANRGRRRARASRKRPR